jgi:hypothetical protein
MHATQALLPVNHRRRSEALSLDEGIYYFRIAIGDLLQTDMMVRR